MSKKLENKDRDKYYMNIGYKTKEHKNIERALLILPRKCELYIAFIS